MQKTYPESHVVKFWVYMKLYFKNKLKYKKKAYYLTPDNYQIKIYTASKTMSLSNQISSHFVHKLPWNQDPVELGVSTGHTADTRVVENYVVKTETKLIAFLYFFLIHIYTFFSSLHCIYSWNSEKFP